MINESEKTVIKTVSLCGFLPGGAPAAVDVQNDKIVRVRPLHYDWKYSKDKMNPWKLKRNAKTMVVPLKSLPGPYSLAYKKRAYSPNRIKYPIKRVDWDPNGERNPQNRGISKYKRISWDEATDIIASELKRVIRKYGPCGILAQCDGHAECKLVHAPHGCMTLLLKQLGGYTHQVRQPDSWEGWYWGAMHVWGTGYVGMQFPQDNLMHDITVNSDLVLFWGCDPETTPWGFVGQMASLICYFWREAGIKQVYICPELNYGAAIHADKWIPVLPNTDAALQLAIIYMWITEGTYDKDYVATHTVGFDKVKDYVIGKEDGIPKTPEWASPKCGVPEWTIKALARDYATKVTSICHYFGGGFIRGPYSTEPGRLEVIMLGMQGLGKPGVNQLQLGFRGGARPEKSPILGGTWVDPTITLGKDDRIIGPHAHTTYSHGKQLITKTNIQEAILKGTVTAWGIGRQGAEVEDQFVKYTYPLPKEEGGTEIHLVWTDTPCRTTCWGDGNKTIEAFRSPKIECVIAQHPWLENDCLLADIILPANTTFEVDDIVANTAEGGMEWQSVTIQDRAIPPIGESKSDYEIVIEIAKKMGLDKKVTRGKDIEEWRKYVYDKIFDLRNVIDWDELKEKQYYVCPVAKGWEKDPAGLIKFYQDPKKYPLKTPSGKLEFYSKRLAKHFPNDEERPPIPKWIEKGITHDERLSSDRARIYPLLIMSNHPKWRTHAQGDDISWTRETPTCKVMGWDGYKYEPMWINPQTAAPRGIKNGDIVKIYNERGIVLAGAYVTERLMPGIVYVDHGARCDWIIPGKLDRGGAINLVSPIGLTSKNAAGQATSGYLVEVEKVTQAEMEEWKKQYPEAFAREYDPDSGLRFNSWIIQE